MSNKQQSDTDLLTALTQLEELLNDLVNDREVYDYQVQEGVEAVETAQNHAVEMLDASEGTGYASWKSEIQSELEAFEGEGPPSIDQLWSVAQHQSESAASWIHDMPCTEQEIQRAKGDVLKALVAIEMAEDRLNEVSG